MSRSALSKVRGRGLALEQLHAARSALGAAVADLLAARSVKCAPRCAGWSTVSGVVVLCAPCAELSGYSGVVSDADVSLLPAARRALASASG